MPETLGAPGADFGWSRSEGVLWPWIGRFFWSPAADLHPSRREALLPGWPEAAWSDAAVLAHVSRHLLSTAGLLPDAGRVPPAARADSAAADFRIALLPQAPLTHLARRLGLALHASAPRTAAGEAGEAGDADALDDAERAFLARRVPLYWRAPAVEGDDPRATGWHALCVLLANQSEAVKRRFEWKTPADPGRPAALPDAGALLALAWKILKEFDEPWSSLFATLRRPGCLIRLHG
jgi:hypothetical protein